jgi:hypothetical protein
MKIKSKSSKFKFEIQRKAIAPCKSGSQKLKFMKASSTEALGHVGLYCYRLLLLYCLYCYCYCFLLLYLVCPSFAFLRDFWRTSGRLLADCWPKQGLSARSRPGIRTESARSPHLGPLKDISNLEKGQIRKPKILDGQAGKKVNKWKTHGKFPAYQCSEIQYLPLSEAFLHNSNLGVTWELLGSYLGVTWEETRYRAGTDPV